VRDAGTMALLAADLRHARGGSGQVLAEIDDGTRSATLLLGRDFDLDAELAARIERIVGSACVRLGVIAPPQLALVG
jgi:DNA polymerase-3 subunit alpha